MIDHARHGDEYEVRLEFDPECCTISVVDTGQGFHPMDIEHAMPPPSADGGRGLAIMQALADRLDLASDASAGTVLRLVKGLTVAPGGTLDRIRRQSQSSMPRASPERPGEDLGE